MKILTDDDLFPFGKWKGFAMKSVPVRYLFWLWTNGLESQINTSDVANYISRNLDALKKEHPDGIW